MRETFAAYLITLLVAYASASQAATKEVDLRNRSENDQYFVVLAGSSKGAVGHAFVVWGKEDSQALMSSQAMFGFYPKGGNKNLIGVLALQAVPGELKDECQTGRDVPLEERKHCIGNPDELLITRVNSDVFARALEIRDRWAKATKSKQYVLTRNDCVTFMSEVASELGLTIPTRASIDSIKAGDPLFPTAIVGKMLEIN